jgi:hypothetical protein
MNLTNTPDGDPETNNLAFNIFSVVAPVMFILVILLLLMFFIAHILR